MWTSKNRARYDRSKLRYPSDLTDDEWGLVEPLIPPRKTGGGKRTVIMREVVNGLMYVLSTGCQSRARLTTHSRPYECICRAWTQEPERFTLNPLQQMPELNT
jgi:transposase